MLLAPVVLALLQTAPPPGLDAEAPCAPGAAVVVDGLGTPADDLLRTAELVGAAEPTPRASRRGGVRTASLCEDASLPWTLPPAAGAEVGGLRPSLVPLRLALVDSSMYPASGNDGLLWAGRGVSGVFSGGVALRWGPVSAAVVPELAASANAGWTMVPNGLPGDGRFRNPYHPGAIDLPQRFGDEPFATWGPGQSFLRVDVANLAAGVSTENRWFGPGKRNALVLSNAGPGFPHAFVGTTRPGDVWIGKAEALFVWGRLERSRYAASRKSVYLTGFVVDFAPRWVPNLTLGIDRVFLQPWGDFDAGKVLPLVQPFFKQHLADNPEDNQLFSLFGRWVFPASGLELYGEWGREDHAWSWQTFLRRPDDSQAYLLGLEKVWTSGPRWIRLQAELTHLQENRPAAAVWYTHGANVDHTHQGQLLGASIGPGGDAQYLALDVIGPRGRIGGFVERVRRNDDHYWVAVYPQDPGPNHDAELTAGLRGVVLRSGLEVSWEAAGTYRTRRDFLYVERGLHLALGIAFPAGAAPGSPR